MYAEVVRDVRPDTPLRPAGMIGPVTASIHPPEP
jgi:hypothetical protein